MDEDTLHRLAVEALLEEAKHGASRAAISGPSGWVKKKETINKRFLHSTLRNAVLSNRLKTCNDKNKHNTASNKPLENK